MFVFQWTVQGSAHTLSSESGNKLQPWELHSASQHQAALNFVCEHLCFISICFVHPLARCVLKVIASSLGIILASERFHWHAVLSDSWGKPVLQTAQYAIQVPTKECHSPSSSTRIRSSITVAADFQHTPKGIRVEIKNETLCSGKNWQNRPSRS